MSEVHSPIEELQARGLLFQTTGDEALAKHLSSGSRTLYCGFDPTADSLHIGSLVPLLTLKRFQLAGHKPIALVGGATGLVGDPSFKTQERDLNSRDIIESWVAKIRVQMSRYLDFDCGAQSAVVVNNLDWTQNVDVLSFLRDVGKHFSVNNMIQRESVRQRIERGGTGISFTEFTYMILQAYDFAELANRYDCSLQIGGSDQWGNIVGGVDLCRRMYSKQVHAMTMPLVTKADGTKFGKTESGTIWLDPTRTSPYAFYQFWLNAADADVYSYLKFFTFIPVPEINDLERADAERQGRPEAQGVLAEAVTRFIHGDEGLSAARRISDALFQGTLEQMSESDLQQLSLDGLPTTALNRSQLNEGTLTQLLANAGLAGSGKQIKDALGRQAVTINNLPVGMDDNTNLAGCFPASSALHERYYLTRVGKKKYHLFEID